MTTNNPVPVSFWGTPEISATLLQTLLSDSRFSVRFIVTQPDKARSARGRGVLPSPVKKIAMEAGIPVFEPETLRLKKRNKEEVAELLRQMKDFHVLFHIILAYGKIIPRDFFATPELGGVNFHASKLPLLRGAAPIEFALLHGFSETGWSLQKITEELDAGDVLASTTVPIEPVDDRSTLYQKLTDNLLENAPAILLDYSNGKLTAIPQDFSKATFCSKISTEMGQWNSQETGLVQWNKVRALSERPGIYSSFRGKKIKLFADFNAPLVLENAAPGSLHIRDSLLYIACRDGLLPFSGIQFEGKKRMAIPDFLNGYRPTPADRLET